MQLTVKSVRACCYRALATAFEPLKELQDFTPAQGWDVKMAAAGVTLLNWEKYKLTTV